MTTDDTSRGTGRQRRRLPAAGSLPATPSRPGRTVPAPTADAAASSGGTSTPTSTTAPHSSSSFMDKDVTEPQKPLDPLVRINLDLPDGRSLQKTQHFAPENYSAATDHADVRIAENRFEGDLHRYHITAAIDEVSVDVTPYRPGPSVAAGDRLRLLRRRPGP